MDSLLEYGHLEVGLAAARWLALQPGYRFRYEACAALLEAGQTEATIPLLKFLAYEDHGETGQRAGQRLLALGEAGLVAALFIRVAHLGDSRLRYQASLALALTGHAEEDEAIIPERGDLKAAIFEERHRAYQTAVQNFCQVSIHALDRLEASDDQARAARSLARFSLLWMADLPKAFEQIEQLDELLTSQYSVLCLNAAQFNLKVGRLKKAKGTLLELISGGREKLSSSVRIHTMKVFERFYLPDAVQPLITALNDEDSSVRSAAASALGQLAHPDAVQPLITALSDEDSSVRSAA
ncbi:MAG: HEAT repeat domain-containing protein, partial [Anaerolineae bacterium]|nr:HEAT repeat domain-containing protein [Anaerolineae bacterium]